MSTSATFTADVTPTFDGLTPVFELSVFKMVPGGICGPGESATCLSMDAVVEALSDWGFELAGPFGPVCANGFASAPLIRLADLDAATIDLPAPWNKA
jgi:hypothetical protein